MPQPTVTGRLAEQQSPAIAAACGCRWCLP